MEPRRHRDPVPLRRLLSGVAVAEVRGAAWDVAVEAVEHDSRVVGPGSLFCCLPGAVHDGHQFAAAAAAAGASCLLVERFVDVDLPQVRTVPGGARPAMAKAAAEFYGHPDRRLAVVGVTGTNGKTTVVHLLRSILEQAGRPAGTIGTLTGTRTTPEAPELYARLAGFVDDGLTAVAMEVSSHALSQHRVDGIVFDVAVFTNLSHDHLDHHGSMEEYFAAKSRLFEQGRADAAVVCVDDVWGRQLAGRLAGRTVTEVRTSDASDVELGVGRTVFTWEGRRVSTTLTGDVNVTNSLLAAEAARRLGVDDDTIVAGLGAAGPVPGRMDVVARHPVTVVVDYAHTPDGLSTALDSARRLAAEHRVVCVFGCGGDRDAAKRPVMGEIAAGLADAVVVTSDNPRFEDPAAIIEAIVSGARRAVRPPGAAPVVVEPDRGRAIEVAVGLACPGDVVLVAGKGHETTQVVGDVVRPFDDRVEVRRAVEHWAEVHAQEHGGGTGARA
ncbi:MAG: UDP-N-acetylmuramoyl-L-alanyl-D-glutamate--2,6-diaminopimelate ligase [Acidimicrobiales bacterium]